VNRQPVQNTMKAPLFRDPIYDGAADPVMVWNRELKEWWMVYTNRRATEEGAGVAWVHGTDLGVAVSRDGGQSWLYRGILEGLDFEWGRNTFWAPEIIDYNGLYHMYVSYIQGVPIQWAGHKREILHYTSADLLVWQFEAKLELSSDRVIDACVAELPGGGFRMWYKDEANGSHTYAADSEDLYTWRVTGPVVGTHAHEGANVFSLGGSYWMIVDEWKGQGVYCSADLEHWERNGQILAESGSREDDQGFGFHADVVTAGERAWIFYFTHPGRIPGTDNGYEGRRSSIQAAELTIEDGKLVCRRDNLPGCLAVPEQS
jgi:hypothetical protein